MLGGFSVGARFFCLALSQSPLCWACFSDWAHFFLLALKPEPALLGVFLVGLCGIVAGGLKEKGLCGLCSKWSNYSR